MNDYVFTHGLELLAAFGALAGTITLLDSAHRGSLRHLWEQLTQWRRPLLLYVSWGGTCRDPMAKVLTEVLLKDRRPKFRVLSARARNVDIQDQAPVARTGEACIYAVQVIKDELHRDHLTGYKIGKLSKRLLKDASLVILFSDEFRADVLDLEPLALKRTVVFDEFLGCEPIPNPWEPGMRKGDEKAKARYEVAYRALREVLTKPDNQEKLYRAVVE